VDRPRFPALLPALTGHSKKDRTPLRISALVPMTWFVERLSHALSTANLKPLKISRARPLMELGSAEHWVTDQQLAARVVANMPLI
jgi:hypothetical protein